MPLYYCIACGRATRHLNVCEAADAVQVTRTTIYNWIAHSHLHLVVHASGRKYICEESLMSPVFMIGKVGAHHPRGLVPAVG